MKKRLIVIITAIILAGSSVYSQDGRDKNFITGSWMGRLNAGAVTLRIIFNISLVENDSLTATLDSPDQGAKNIKLGPVTYDSSGLKISAGAMLAEYNGTIRNDTLIEGNWKQAGSTFELNLARLKSAFALKRPQEPQPPFPYKSTDVTFRNEKSGFDLAGTLTIPDGSGPFPAVILITGSGAQNRNEELLGHKPFLVLADYLTRNGIAVLRYDDRGVGQSKGDYLSATSADLATDAEAAYLFLRDFPVIDTRKIGLAGHSEGGLIAPIVASSNRDVAFIISLAGTGVPGESILHKQNYDISIASGMGEKEIREGIAINRKLFALLRKEKDNKKAEAGMTELYRSFLEKKGMTEEDISKALAQFKAGLNPLTYDWLRYFISTDPAVFWKSVKCPVLALNGEKDLQVAAGINLTAIEKALRKGGNKNVRAIEFPGLNHLFQHCSTCLVSEYGEIEETISPEVLETIAGWVRDFSAGQQAF